MRWQLIEEAPTWIKISLVEFFFTFLHSNVCPRKNEVATDSGSTHLGQNQNQILFDISLLCVLKSVLRAVCFQTSAQEKIRWQLIAINTHLDSNHTFRSA